MQVNLQSAVNKIGKLQEQIAMWDCNVVLIEFWSAPLNIPDYKLLLM